MAYPTVSGPYGLIPVKLLSGTPFVGGVYRSDEDRKWIQHFDFLRRRC
jgi:hypothetical protein